MSEAIKNVKKEAQVKDLFKLGAHFGYSRSRRHPSATPFIFGFKNRTAIIDLEKTIDSLDRAKAFAYDLGAKGKKILFVGTKNEAILATRKAAESIDMPYVIRRWLGGTLTNVEQIRKRIARLVDLKTKKEKGELAVYTKKERLMIDKEIADLEDSFGSLGDLKEIPAAMFVVDSGEEAIAVAEAKKLGLTIITLSNSDCDLRGIAYPIVANDAARESINYFVNEIAESYEDGKKNPASVAETPKVPAVDEPVAV